MMTIELKPVGANNDAELVLATLEGDRDSFGQIVSRYQSLVCSLAYSATGSLGQSEDLAQETFITAWRHLGHLRERDKLRAWLCGIARNRINSFLRREGREPIRRAESLEDIPESHAPEPLPVDQAITNEEAAILWRSLEHIPPIYRDPLILFYREHRSVEAVAQQLELSEEVVRQRLSRGRKMLQEQVLTFIESALERTNPGKAFAVGVMAALPLMAATAKAAGVGATAAKSGALAKATGLGAIAQSVFKFFAPVGMFLSLGGWVGYKMGDDAGKSQSRQDSVARFWSIVMAGFVIFVLLPILLMVPLMLLFGSKESFLAAFRIWLDILFVLVAAAFGIWLWQRHRPSQPETPVAGGTIRKVLVWSVVLATLMAGAFFALGLSDSNFKVQRITESQAQQVITAHGGAAEIFVMRCFDHSMAGTPGKPHDELWIELAENGKVMKYIAPADESLLSRLAQQGIKYPTYVQGRDFEIFGTQGKVLMGLCLLVLAAGIAVFVTMALRNRSKAPLMTTGTKIGIVAAALVVTMVVAPLVWLNHRKANTVRPNFGMQSEALTPEQASGAKQTANDFFQALNQGDWNHIAKLCPPGFNLADKLNDQQKSAWTGVELVSLGEPFKQASYAGIYVPYEIRFKDGEVKKHKLAVRQDNPGHQWYFDGGF